MLKIIRKSKFVNNVSWMVGGRIFQMILSFLISIFTTRYLGPSNFGIINYVASYCALFTPICTLGFNDTISKELIDNKDKNGEVLGTMLFLRLACSFLSVVIISVLVYLLNANDKLYLIIAVIQSLSLVFQCFEVITFWYQTNLMARTTTIVSSVAYFLVAIYRTCILILEKDIAWFAVYSSLDVFLIATITLIVYKRGNGQKLSFSFDFAKKMLSRSYNFILSGLMVAIYGQMDKIMLKHMLDSVEVGYYSAALALCNTWPFILVAIINSAKPIIIEKYKLDREDYVNKLRQLYFVVIYFGVFVGLVFSVLAKPIILIIYGKAYLNAVPILRVIVWYTSFSYLGVARIIWSVCENKQSYEKYFALIGALLNIVLNYFLISQFGAIGAALATLITQVVTNVAVPYIIRGTRQNSILIFEAILFKGIDLKQIFRSLIIRKEA